MTDLPAAQRAELALRAESRAGVGSGDPLGDPPEEPTDVSRRIVVVEPSMQNEKHILGEVVDRSRVNAHRAESAANESIVGDEEVIEVGGARL